VLLSLHPEDEGETRIIRGLQPTPQPTTALPLRTTTALSTNNNNPSTTILTAPFLLTKIPRMRLLRLNYLPLALLPLLPNFSRLLLLKQSLRISARTLTSKPA
jgi:hypothetical protein